MIQHLKQEKNMIEFSEIIKKRRAVREFEDRSVPHDIIEKIITDSCQAPSAANERPWRFIIIHDQDLIKRLSDESKANFLSIIDKDPKSTLARYKSHLENPEFNVFYNTPCLIIIAGPESHRTLRVDCALCVSYIMFSAVAQGLGTCWVDLGGDIRDPELLKEIGLPDGHKIVAPVIVGYPKKIPKMSEKRNPQIFKVIT
jgi:nitroreductase